MKAEDNSHNVQNVTLHRYPVFDKEKFAEFYQNMERVGNGISRKVIPDNMEEVYYELLSHGVEGNQLKAIMGVIAEESGGDPFAVSKDGKFRGLSQWSFERMPKEEFERIQSMSTKDAISYGTISFNCSNA